MAIPREYRGRFIYHFTHLRNLPNLVRSGLLSPNELKRLGLAHKSIANQEIQNRRSKMGVTCGPGGVVHDYVPFYFCSFSSMLLSVVNAKNVDQQFLVYLAVPVEVIDRHDVVFSNASANTVVPPAFFTDPADLCQLNWSAIDKTKWSLGPEDNQARMAEVLIHNRVGIDQVDHVIVWNEQIREKVTKIFTAGGLAAPSIRFEGRPGKYHYVKDYPDNPKHSLVTGPHFTRVEFEKAVKQILTARSKSFARFANTTDLLGALRNDLASVPETAELIGLESANIVHKEDVGKHTQSVVRTLVLSNQFAALDDDAKRMTELAAFLHDIGKGPKSRWVSRGGKQKSDPDHPIKSVKMLVRILSEDVKEIEACEVRVLAKLVCYHDLVGDILGKGRDAEQLEVIADSERDLDMLIALGLADMRAVKDYWYYNHEEGVLLLRERVLNKLKSGD